MVVLPSGILQIFKCKAQREAILRILILRQLMSQPFHFPSGMPSGMHTGDIHYVQI